MSENNLHKILQNLEMIYYLLIKHAIVKSTIAKYITIII